MNRRYIHILLMILFLVGCSKKTTTMVKTTSPNQTGNNPSQATPNTAENPVVIADVLHSNDGLETIIITNVSPVKQDINGFSLLITLTGEHINILNVVLEPGTSYRIYNGKTAKDQKDGLAWLDHPALQEAGDDITLLNHAGRLIWVYSYYP